LTSFDFHVTHRDGLARRGELRTPHGVIQTPVFMPVGTRGAVKAVTHRDLEELGAEVILGNTYHLFLRPGSELIARAGGLHAFIGWRRAILTDSGGYQVFSLAGIRKIREEGAEFRSHLDGSLHLLTPELATDVQAQLGSDIAMVLDECIATPAGEDDARRAMERSVRWAQRARQRFVQLRDDPGPVVVTNPGQAQFGIIQGATVPALRTESVQATVAIGDGGDRLRGLRHRRPQRRRAAGGHLRRRRAHRRVAARRPAALPDGERHARRSVRMRRARRRHVRLRAPDPQRAQRSIPDQRRAAEHQERAIRRGRPAPRSGVRLLHLPPLFQGLSSPPVRLRRDRRSDP
jgi:hypothetical protein